MKRFVVLPLLILAFCVPIVAYSSVSAKTIFDDACSGGSAQANSSVCGTKDNTTNPVSGTNSIIYKVTRLVALVTGVAAVLMIIYTGARLVLSGGEPEKVANARRGLLYSIVGLVVVLLAQAIISYILVRIL